MSEYRLSREDWNKLDDLLGKHGFGGYYDLVETLKDTASHLGIGNLGIDLYPEGKGISLPQIVIFLRDWAFLLSKSKEFQKLAEKIAEEAYIEKGKDKN